MVVKHFLWRVMINDIIHIDIYNITCICNKVCWYLLGKVSYFSVPIILLNSFAAFKTHFKLFLFAQKTTIKRCLHTLCVMSRSSNVVMWNELNFLKVIDFEIMAIESRTHCLRILGILGISHMTITEALESTHCRMNWFCLCKLF